MQSKTTATTSCSILAYLVSTGVKLLDANATGLFLPWLSFCISTALSPTFDASTCSVIGLVVSKFCRQASLLTAFQFLKFFLMDICPLKKILLQQFPEIGSEIKHGRNKLA